MSALPPDSIMRQIAEAIPQDVRGDIIIIGSLAAGYQLPTSGRRTASPSRVLK